ncbi:translation initiation factor IF-2 N-terminal domain-containing protein [Amycolatopsis sp. M39]|uniref:translation initiation factor IF-2 N-terminal domain-containing protein n=1 Tax=Amycolatopsis sp. M39 TaxID=1825094 RepID=UPI0007E1879B|nr:translation initiation factor IF-2 N-terminal domain-containing protein [Amycolatopsis sp. M39]OAP23609.1 Ribonuclease G [Amycolatopsis sp. M39]
MSNADTPADQTGGNTVAPTTSRLGELPPRIRVHALAKLLGLSSRDLLGKLAELGESPRSAQSSVTKEVAHRVAVILDAETAEATGQSPAAAEPEAAAGTEAAEQTGATAGAQDSEEAPEATQGTAAQTPESSEAVAQDAASRQTAAPEAVVAPGAGASDTATPETGAEQGAGASDTAAPEAVVAPGAGASDTAAPEAVAAPGAGASDTATPETGAEQGAGASDTTAPEAVAAPGTGASDTATPKTGAEQGTASEAASRDAAPARPFSAESAEPEAARETGEKRTRTRRARRAVAPAIPAEQQETEQAAPVRGPVHVPVFAAPSPVFLPPEPAQQSRTKPEPVFGAGEPPAQAERPDRTAETAEEDISDETRDERSDEDGDDAGGRRRRRRGRRGRGRGKGGDEAQSENEDETSEGQHDQQAKDSKDAKDTKDKTAKPDEMGDADAESDDDSESDSGSKRRRRRRRRKGGDDDGADTNGTDDPPNTVTHVRQAKAAETERPARDEVRSVRGSTRLEAKRQRRRDGREAGRRRAPILSEAEFLARRESVERTMVVAEKGESTQIAVLEDGVLVEHFLTSSGTGSIVGNVYLGRVQNVLPSMEAAFIDIGRGRNAVLYAGEVDWDSAGLEGKARKIEQALSTGDSVLVQVTKDPVGHKGARLTTQISLPGRFLVYVPAGGATGISRKLPENERRRLKDILKRIVPEDAGVIIRTASEGIGEDELGRDVDRLKAQWDVIKEKAAAASGKKGNAPTMLYEEPDLLVKVVRDLFTEDFVKLEVQGGRSWDTINDYVQHVAPDLADRLKRYTGTGDAFADHRIDEQITKALDRKVWLPSGGYLVIDRTEAMTVIDVNTGKFTGSGGNLEETVTRNNLESAEEIVRQLRLRDIGGIIVIDFIDMVLESNRELVLRRLTECLGRDRTRHQVAEVTSLGLVQMTRKKIGTGLLEAFSTPCEHCKGRGVVVSTEPQRTGGGNGNGHNGGGNGHNGHSHGGGDTKSSRRSRGRGKGEEQQHHEPKPEQPAPAPTPEQRESVVSAVQAMANASKAKHEHPDTEAAEGKERETAEQAAAPDKTEDKAEDKAEAPAPVQQPEAKQPEPAASQAAPEADAPEADAPEADAPEADAGEEPEVDVPAPAVRSTRRRPRRTASRPAGPPVKASDQS